MVPQSMSEDPCKGGEWHGSLADPAVVKDNTHAKKAQNWSRMAALTLLPTAGISCVVAGLGGTRLSYLRQVGDINLPVWVPIVALSAATTTLAILITVYSLVFCLALIRNTDSAKLKMAIGIGASLSCVQAAVGGVTYARGYSTLYDLSTYAVHDTYDIRNTMSKEVGMLATSLGGLLLAILFSSLGLVQSQRTTKRGQRVPSRVQDIKLVRAVCLCLITTAIFSVALTGLCGVRVATLETLHATDRDHLIVVIGLSVATAVLACVTAIASVVVAYVLLRYEQTSKMITPLGIVWLCMYVAIGAATYARSLGGLNDYGEADYYPDHKKGENAKTLLVIEVALFAASLVVFLVGLLLNARVLRQAANSSFSSRQDWGTIERAELEVEKATIDRVDGDGQPALPTVPLFTHQPQQRQPTWTAATPPRSAPLAAPTTSVRANNPLFSGIA